MNILKCDYLFLITKPGGQASASANETYVLDALKHQLDVCKHLERELLEKKSDLDAMSKNGVALARLCNKNSLTFPFSSASFSSNMYLASQMPEDEEQRLVKDCQAAHCLKQLISQAVQKYEELKAGVNSRRDELEAILWKSTGFDEKLEALSNSIKQSVETCEFAEPVSAHPDRLRAQIDDNRQLCTDLNKRKMSLDSLKDLIDQDKASSFDSSKKENLQLLNFTGYLFE